MLLINGNPMEKAIGKTILEVLQSEGYQVERVIAELNEEFIPKAKYESTLLQEGDVLEVISFVGGG